MHLKPIDSGALALSYARFGVSEKLLLTGHSHQAWPDVAFRGLELSFEDAAREVDQKWGRAFEKANQVRGGFRRLLGGIDGDLALAPNTHDLLIRLLSALPFRERREIIVTDGEFHTVRRQLLRLQEEGFTVTWVPALPAETIGQRLAEKISSKTALVICSTVFFETARLARGLGLTAEVAAAAGAAFLLDTYHQLNVVPFDPTGLETAYFTGGGYKYCQLGEGNCFLRSPRNCEARPIVTGWFADYAALESPPGGRVAYGNHEGARFAGATYDPVSHYRAAEVFDFFLQHDLTVDRLRERSQVQLQLLAEGVDRLKLADSILTRDRSAPLSEFGGFLSLRTPHAAALEAKLKGQGLFTDYRGSFLRLGPAPYLTDEQLNRALFLLGQTIRAGL